jgi:hypothetical protein
MNNKLQLTSYGSRVTGHGSRKNTASALILAVVLTSLLAIIGVMFVMIARVDKMATSAISENKELNFAVETVVAKISQELVLDVPGVAGQEYYDYPGEEDKWLASLEPYKDGTDYKWRQISDIYNRLDANNLQAIIIPDYQKPSDVGDSNSTDDYPADADGDGVADSVWVKIPEMTSNKGKPIYAAIRIVDNGGMINVNTAYKFDPNVGPADANLIDGSSQTQINLLALSERGSTSNPLGKLDDARFGSEPLPHVLDDYIEDVVWRYNEPNGAYTPFDISDELKLRNRYILNYNLMTSRIEGLWTRSYDGGLGTPRTDQSQLKNDPNYWFWKTNDSSADVNQYDYRHISTIYNMDRIIDPNGNKMTNINKADAYSIYRAVKSALDPNFVDANGVAAQIAVNLVDFRDGATDPNVTTFDVNGKIYYGFETQPFISEIAAIIDTIDPNNKSFYALELYNPFNNSVSLSDFVLSISNGSNISLSGTIDPNGYFVISNDLTKFTINTTHTQQDPGLKFSGDYVDNLPPGGDGIFDSWSNYNITLKRTVGGSDIIILDFQDTNNVWFQPVGNTVYAQRDTGNWHVVYQTMEPNLPGTLGSSNTVPITRKNYNLSLANDKFVTVGDIARVLTAGPSPDQNDMIGVRLAAEPNEDWVRLNLQNAAFQQIFNYLTVFDPNSDTIDNDGDGLIDALDTDTPEYKVPGRININTAPWYVLAQLPWVSQRIGSTDYSLAQAIVAYRDKLDLSLTGGPDYSNSRELETGITGISEANGFRSIGELMNVINTSGKTDYDMRYYTLGAASGKDLTTFPDLTPSDGAVNDFEERDVIFARISNLVTVRSDVFTAYILVRIGADGPQKRVMVILDRSNVYSGDGKVRIVALHPVPDPR